MSFRRKETNHRKRYKPHGVDGVKLTLFQEFCIYMMYLKLGLRTDVLADRWLGNANARTMERIEGVLKTWCAAVYKILKAQTLWLKPEFRDRVKSVAFSNSPNVLCIADCTKVLTESSQQDELIRQQLYSLYYGHTCAKYCVVCSPIGGTLACSYGMGGPADDYVCLDAAGLFEEDKWQVPKGEPKPVMQYDAGATSKTRSRLLHAGCHLETSGSRRATSDTLLSLSGRFGRRKVSGQRMRVENFICIVKNRFQVLKEVISMNRLGMVDKIVYTCFVLHNFANPIIN